ncbi:MAG: ATP-binding protein [Promethearchaeota archaeon]
MIEDALTGISRIFVGRERELRQLEGLWELACQPGEHRVYVLLNAPGTGKTTLLTRFGEILEGSRRGLFIRYPSTSNYDDWASLNEDIVRVVLEAIREKRDLVEAYIDARYSGDERAEALENFEQFVTRLKRTSRAMSISLNEVGFLLKLLSGTIPLFFATDEIQELQELELPAGQGRRAGGLESGLHYLSRLLKDLLNSRTLLLLSGTRYHVLSQIGMKIGSPIRQKVEPIVVTRFERGELEEYVERVRDLAAKAGFTRDTPGMAEALSNLGQFLFAFSGGHPRTVATVARLFITSLEHILGDPHYSEYDYFTRYLHDRAVEYFKETILSSEQVSAIRNLAASRLFPVVKKWILDGGTAGSSLGPRPALEEDPVADEEVRDLVFNLVNVGVVLQNGNAHYFLTSHFHFLEFLKVFHDPYDAFLRQVLHNRFFQLMCGRHAGLGYTFENVFAAALLTSGGGVGRQGSRGSASRPRLAVPLEPARLRTLVSIPGEPDWEQTIEKAQPDILYHLPDARAVDMFALQSGTLFLIQLTTANPPDPSKITALDDVARDLSPGSGGLPGTSPGGRFGKVSAWVVSLYEFSEGAPQPERCVVTAGGALVPVLGEGVVDRLREVKESFDAWR